MILSELVTILTEAQAALDQVPQLATALVTANQEKAALQTHVNEQASTLAALTMEHSAIQIGFDEQTSELMRLHELIAQYAPFTNTSYLPLDHPDLVALHVYLATPPTPSMVNGGYGEWIGRTWQSWYFAGLMGYLASGDITIIDRLEEVMESLEAIMRSPISISTPPVFYTINESLACSMLLLHTVVLKSHGRNWQKWHCIWQERYPMGVVGDDVVHCYFASIESYAYLYMITGDEAAAAERDRRIGIALPHFVPMSNGAFELNQRMPINEARTNVIETPVAGNYLRYTLGSILCLDEAGIKTIDPQWYADTVVIRMFRPDGLIAFFLDGTLEVGDRDFNYDKWRSSNLCLMGGLRPEIAEHNSKVSAVQDSMFMAAARLYSTRRRQ